MATANSFSELHRHSHARQCQVSSILAPAQFEQRFGPNAADAAKVIAHFNKLGLSATRSTATTLTITGSQDAMERAFSVSLHSFEVPRTAKTWATPITRR